MSWLSIMLSTVISWLVSELLFAGYIRGIFHESYVFSQIVFFLQITFFCLILDVAKRATYLRYILVIMTFYMSSYLTYHVIHLATYGVDAWLNMLSVHKVLVVFGPNCLVGLTASVAFLVALEIQIRASYRGQSEPPPV